MASCHCGGRCQLKVSPQAVRESGQAVPSLLLRLQSDFQEMVRTCPVFRLSVTDNGNCFLLHDEAGHPYEPPTEAGLYSIFTSGSVVYFGEATDLCRRQLKDPDNTADSTKTFDNQGRAIVKLITHRGWARELGLYPMFMQIYAGSCALATRDGQTFEQVYKVRETTHAEGGRRIVAKRSRCCGGKGETRVSLSIPSLAEREAGKLRLFDAQSLRQERSGKRFNGNFHSRPEKRRNLEWGGPK